LLKKFGDRELKTNEVEDNELKQDEVKGNENNSIN
jgi:hypothetical protein